MDAQPKAPLAKGGWFGEAKPGGFPRLAGFHIGLYFQEVPPVNPSVTATPCQPPLAREPCGQCPLTISHGSFLRFVTSLTRPVSFYGAIPGFFRLSIDSVGNKHSQNHNPKRGQGLKPRTRAKAKGQSSDGSTRGILKGGAIRAGASCSPLEPASLHTFLPEQESMAAGRQDKPI